MSVPVTHQVTDFELYTGHVEAIHSVERRARVTGYLEKVEFKEGAEVKEGDRLFLIDPRTYQAEYDRAEANVNLAKAHLSRVEADFRRAATLLPKQAISQGEYDKANGDRDEAVATVSVAEAALAIAKRNLDFTEVIAPVSGRISRQMLDPGNLVKADETILTTIVSLDPMYVYFDVDERTMLRIRRLIADGKLKSARETAVSIQVGLADETGFSHEGTIDFIDNRVDASTGTLRLRGIVPNPKRLLSPGMFVRVRVPIGNPHDAILIPERALNSDQGQSFVYVVDKDNHAVTRPVKLGKLDGEMRVIESGLAMGERVVTKGQQRVRPNAVVDAKPAGKEAKQPENPKTAESPKQTESPKTGEGPQPSQASTEKVAN